MKASVRDYVRSVSMYLEEINNETISDDQDVQRAYCWDNKMLDELVYSVIEGLYVPPIITAEENLENGMTQEYIVDGMQRTSALNLFRNFNHKIGNLENPIIIYQEIKKENGRTVKDEKGNIVWETKEFNLKGKTFEQLPKELQNRFDSYQLRFAIYQDCTIPEISKLVRKYNFHKSMNTSQKAFTYIDVFARKIKAITKGNFFLDTVKATNTTIKSGVYEQAVCDAVMAVNFMDSWNNKPDKRNSYLNENATSEMFTNIDKYFDRIASVCEDNYQSTFAPKDIPVWLSVFDYFVCNYNMEDSRFAEFVGFFNEDEERVKTLQKIKGESSTKAKSVVVNKVSYLVELMNEYFGINSDDSLLDFVRENVSEDIEIEDIKTFEEDLEMLSLDVDNNSPLLSEDNRRSLVAAIAYSYLKDFTIDAWFVDFFGRVKNYDPDQKQNYLLMKNDMLKYGVA